MGYFRILIYYLGAFISTLFSIKINMDSKKNTRSSINHSLSKVPSLIPLNKINGLVKLAALNEKYKNGDYTKEVRIIDMPNDYKQYEGKTLDLVISEFESQLNNRLREVHRISNQANKTLSIKDIKPSMKVSRKPGTSSGVGNKAILNPFLVSDQTFEFLDNVNFGNLLYSKYRSAGEGMEMFYLDGSDEAAVKKAFTSTFPQEKCTDDVVKSHSVRKLLELSSNMKMLNAPVFNRLMNLYIKANSLVGKTTIVSKKTNKESEREVVFVKGDLKKFLQSKVTWTRDGKRLVDEGKINSNRKSAENALRNLEKAEADFKEFENLHSNFLKGEKYIQNGIRYDKAIATYNRYSDSESLEKMENKREELAQALSDANDVVESIVKKIAGDAFSKSSSSVKNLTRLLHQDMTFLDVLTEQGKFIPEKNCLVGNYTSVIVNYLRLPTGLVDSDLLEDIKEPRCIDDSMNLQTSLGNLLDAVKL